MRKLNNNGLALVEMLMGLAFLAMLLPLVYYLFQFGQEAFTYNSRLMAQQYVVTNTMMHIRRDIHEAASVSTEATADGVYPRVVTLRLGFIKESTTINKCKYWRFYGKSPSEPAVLQYSGEVDASHIVDDSEYLDVVTGLDISGCNFERTGGVLTSDGELVVDDTLTVEIKPFETNTGRGQGKNIKEPVKTEISIFYKDY